MVDKLKADGITAEHVLVQGQCHALCLEDQTSADLPSGETVLDGTIAFFHKYIKRVSAAGPPPPPPPPPHRRRPRSPAMACSSASSPPSLWWPEPAWRSPCYAAAKEFSDCTWSLLNRPLTPDPSRRPTEDFVNSFRLRARVLELEIRAPGHQGPSSPAGSATTWSAAARSRPGPAPI